MRFSPTYTRSDFRNSHLQGSCKIARQDIVYTRLCFANQILTLLRALPQPVMEFPPEVSDLIQSAVFYITERMELDNDKEVGDYWLIFLDCPDVTMNPSRVAPDGCSPI
jgi:hypothetical protein